MINRLKVNALYPIDVNMFRIVKLSILLCSFVFIFHTIAYSEKVPSGTIEIDEEQFGFILNGSKGEGILHYQDVDYSFKLQGIKIGGMGISKISAAGQVYDLNDVSKFPGTYVAGEYGISIGGGMGGTLLKNQNGVYLNVHSTIQGVSLNIGVEGITIELKDAIVPEVEVQENVNIEVQENTAIIYIVESGDTLYEISQKYGVSVADIKSANNLDSNIIKVGQRLEIAQ